MGGNFISSGFKPGLWSMGLKCVCRSLHGVTRNLELGGAKEVSFIQESLKQEYWHCYFRLSLLLFYTSKKRYYDTLFPKLFPTSPISIIHKCVPGNLPKKLVDAFSLGLSFAAMLSLFHFMNMVTFLDEQT